MALNLARGLVMGMLLAASLAAWEAWQCIRIHDWNDVIAGRRSAPTDLQAPAAVRFAEAYALATRGNIGGALDAYRELESQASPGIRRAAKFNSANLYFQLYLADGARGAAGPALTSVELAKQSYRELLREDSDDWDARYNLERALRAAPDPEQSTQDFAPPPDTRHTPLTAPGSALGLP